MKDYLEYKRMFKANVNKLQESHPDLFTHKLINDTNFSEIGGEMLGLFRSFLEDMLYDISGYRLNISFDDDQFIISYRGFVLIVFNRDSESLSVMVTRCFHSFNNALDRHRASIQTSIDIINTGLIKKSAFNRSIYFKAANNNLYLNKLAFCQPIRDNSIQCLYTAVNSYYREFLQILDENHSLILNTESFECQVYFNNTMYIVTPFCMLDLTNSKVYSENHELYSTVISKYNLLKQE